ncbi:MAG TPA: hypothetical protein VGO59_21140 [Verrucomicrobiae bacterium]|jgi:hypothetical protein
MKAHYLHVIWRLVLASVLLPVSAVLGEPLFRVFPTTEATMEGGNANLLAIQTDKEHFDLRVPKGYGVQIHQTDQSIVFSSETGSTVITIKMSTNFAGKLPKMETLRDQVAGKHPAASLVMSSPCITSCGVGLLFDLFQPVSGDLTMRMRDAYIPFADGSFEFTFSCDLREYDTHRLDFAWLLNSFRLQAQPAMNNP